MWFSSYDTASEHCGRKLRECWLPSIRLHVFSKFFPLFTDDAKEVFCANSVTIAEQQYK